VKGDLNLNKSVGTAVIKYINMKGLKRNMEIFKEILKNPANAKRPTENAVQQHITP